MNTERPNISWPELLNELYDNAIIQELPPQCISLLHAILYKANKLWFRNEIRISNTELQSLANLSPKQFSLARKLLTERLNYAIQETYPSMSEPDFLQYSQPRSQKQAGKYIFNYSRILTCRRTAGRSPENHRNNPGESPEENPKTVRRFSGETDSEGYDHNKQTPNQFKTTTTHNNNSLVVAVDDIYKGIKEEIIFTLRNQRLADEKIAHCIDTYGWETVNEAFWQTNRKHEDGEIGNFAGYFLETVKGMAQKEDS